MDWQRKVLDNDALLWWRRQHQGQKVVFTNGCFDILHIGHLSYLSEARALGDVLIVAVNDDDSVRRLKGQTRPINPLENRMLHLAALQFVDAVVSFHEDTPLRIIQEVNPDVLVKGGDYGLEDIVGSDHVRGAGGSVASIPFVEGYSTTKLIERLMDNGKADNHIEPTKGKADH